MKKTFFILALFTATSFYVASAATVATKVSTVSAAKVNAAPPAAVLQSFATTFGNVAVRQWKLRSNNQWRAHFLRNGRPWEATFTSSGVLVKSEPA